MRIRMRIRMRTLLSNAHSHSHSNANAKHSHSHSNANVKHSHSHSHSNAKHSHSHSNVIANIRWFKCFVEHVSNDCTLQIQCNLGLRSLQCNTFGHAHVYATLYAIIYTIMCKSKQIALLAPIHCWVEKRNKLLQ